MHDLFLTLIEFFLNLLLNILSLFFLFVKLSDLLSKFPLALQFLLLFLLLFFFSHDFDAFTAELTFKSAKQSVYIVFNVVNDLMLFYFGLHHGHCGLHLLA